MFAKFWGKKKNVDNNPSALPKPKELPERVGRFLVVNLNVDPDVVWDLKMVSLPADPPAAGSLIRVFSPDKTQQAGVAVKDFHSLDDRPELILYSGTFDKKTGAVALKDRAALEMAV